MNIKQYTGRILALVVGLHSRAIRAHVKQFEKAEAAAGIATVQAESDVRNAQQALRSAIASENEATAKLRAARGAAELELASLPSITGYGRVRSDPPFGAKPVVIDKRK